MEKYSVITMKNIKKLIRDEGNHSVESYIIELDKGYIDPAFFDNNCRDCYGNPCVCEEIKTWKPIQQYYFWDEKERMMIQCGTFPEHPKSKRMWDQATPLR